jgi:hypothetical protein
MATRRRRREQPGPNSTTARSLAQRIGAATAFFTALFGLLTILVTNFQFFVTKCRELRWCDAQAPADARCWQFREFKYPDSVAYEEWDGEQVQVVGETNCPASGGLYLIFEPRPTSEPFLTLRPVSDDAQCRDSARFKPECWDKKKPIPEAVGRWVWDVPLPPLEPLRSPRDVETFHFRWEIRDSDAPDKTVIAADLGAIEVRAANGSS